MAQTQTQKEITLQLLDEVMDMKEGMAEMKVEVKTINRTIHNGMSTKIEQTSRNVTELKKELEYYKGEGHLSACPFMQERKKKKEARKNGVQVSWKLLIALVGLAVSLGAAVGSWTNIIGGLRVV